MKKWLSLLLCAALLAVPALTLAEETQTFTEENGYYSFSYPADWTILSRETIDAVLTTAETLGDENLQQIVQQAKASIDQLGIVMLLSPDNTTNISIVAQATTTSLTAADLLTLGDQFTQQLTGSLDGLVIVDAPSVLATGENEFLGLTYTYTVMGSNLFGAQCYACPNNVLVCITYTAPVDSSDAYSAVLGGLLESFAY